MKKTDVQEKCFFYHPSSITKSFRNETKSNQFFSVFFLFMNNMYMNKNQQETNTGFIQAILKL